MTTVVRVHACVSDDKEVVVIISEDGVPVESVTLQNGEFAERYAYDKRVIEVSEQFKK